MKAWAVGVYFSQVKTKKNTFILNTLDGFETEARAESTKSSFYFSQHKTNKTCSLYLIWSKVVEKWP